MVKVVPSKFEVDFSANDKKVKTFQQKMFTTTFSHETIFGTKSYTKRIFASDSLEAKFKIKRMFPESFNIEIK